MYIGIDLGTTNIKAAAYDEGLKLIGRASMPVEYVREKGFIELDAEKYFDKLLSLLRGLIRGRDIREIALTGQAETLICLDTEGRPLMNAISWMDERSAKFCSRLQSLFSQDEIEAVTGQLSVLPTWPATKILWLKSERPDIFQKTDKFILLKDYIVYRLTGVMAADMSIATFTLYFDIYKKRYWPEMLSELGISEKRLPKLAEPCTEAGQLLGTVAERLGVSKKARVSIGTLDHFAGMIGTGNIAPGSVTLSTGTVMALAVMAGGSEAGRRGIAMHYGFIPDTYAMLPVAESGGASLEWFKNACMPGSSYAEIDKIVSERAENDIIFLPYVVGTNAPEYDDKATGVFWGLRQEHDSYDMAGAIMEGVSMLLRKNCEMIRAGGAELSSIIATGGGAKSRLWCQLQANATGLRVRVPEESEAATLGAAMIAAACDGAFADLAEAAAKVRFKEEFIPRASELAGRKYRRFCELYSLSLRLRGE